MFSTSESWLGIGVIMIIAFIVVGLATCMGKLIISFFGTGQEGVETSGQE
jgi:Na+-transporting methylmalonyl-CoA/oxaloacetate decarboxylase gamma subunit